ncbi:hypothetical protein, partial [Klebsiella pneumoniae]|uniref:hypothetical protein n=1 Tax=Klebsiella pneumoniae TaxID=573 RepID=UPI00226EA103
VDFDPTAFSQEDLDGDVASAWTVDSTSLMDCVDIVLPSEEAMIGIDKPWDDFHHRSYFVPDVHEVESSLSSPSLTGDVHILLNPLAPAQVFSVGN